MTRPDTHLPLGLILLTDTNEEDDTTGLAYLCAVRDRQAQRVPAVRPRLAGVVISVGVVQGEFRPWIVPVCPQ